MGLINRTDGMSENCARAPKAVKRRDPQKKGALRKNDPSALRFERTWSLSELVPKSFDRLGTGPSTGRGERPTEIGSYTWLEN